MKDASDVYNLAGRTLVVDSVTQLSDSQADSLTATRRAKSLAAQRKTNQRLDKTDGSLDRTNASLCRIGARRDASSTSILHVYAFNPRNAYSNDWSSSYYVDSGYVSYNGARLAVNTGIGSSRHMEFQMPENDLSYHGTWALCIYKADVEDEAYTPIPLLPVPTGSSSSSTMQWRRLDGNVLSPSSVLVIGSFVYDEAGIYNLMVEQNATDAVSFLQSRFLQILGKAEMSSDNEASSWAYAMGVDQIFTRLAALSMFVDNLFVNNLSIPNPSGMSVEIRSRDSNGTLLERPIFKITFGGSVVFQVDAATGNIFLGEPKASLASPASGFMYRKSDGAIVSANEGIIIDKDGVVSSGRGGVFRIFSDFEEGCIAPWKTAYLTGTKYEYMDFSNRSASNAAAIGALLEGLFTQYSSAVKTGVSAQFEGYENAEMLYVYADTVDHTKLLLFTSNFSQNGEFTATHYIERFTYTGSSSSFYSSGCTYYEFGVIDNKLKSGGKPLTWYYNPIFKDSDGNWTIPIQPYNYRMHLWGIAAGMTLYGDVMPTGKVWRACFN